METENPILTALRSAMRKSGLSAYEIARRAGLAYPVVWRIVKGQRGMTLDTAAQLAVAVGMRLELRTAAAARPLRNEREYDAAAAALDKLAVRREGSLTPSERKHLDKLTRLIAAFDRKKSR